MTAPATSHDIGLRRRGRALLLAGLVGAALWGSAGEADAASVKASVKATVKKGVLIVTGTPGDDSITLRLQAGDPTKLEVDVGADGTPDFTFDRAIFTAVTVEGGRGDDTLIASATSGSFTSTVPTSLDGEDGNDEVIGEAGPERLLGGKGNDVVDGNQGADAVALGDGDDVFRWEPGDSSDRIDGGAGADRLEFSGNGASENFRVFTAAGGEARLTRDVANVITDLDAVEVVDIRTAGGADTVTVGDLAATDVTEVRTDLAAVGGGDDGQVDSVVVTHGLTIGQDAQAATVDGLGASIRILNGSPTDRIQVTGTTASDVVKVAGTAGADTVGALANGTDVAVVGATPGLYLNLTGIDVLDVDLAGGNDSFSATGNLADLIHLDVDGGDGDDTLLGGNGGDTLRGGAGDDLVDGNQGRDTVTLGDGSDVFRWDPGDASDVVDGGTGADRLQFNGSGASEHFDLSAAAAGRVRLTRDVAGVVTDLDDVEVVDLRAFGGTDTITVNDLAGTDVTEVRTDLAAAGGGDDGQVDSVVVNGTAGDDTITVADAGSDVVVQGLGATVRISHAGPTSDRLTVNGLAGNDDITATPGAEALIVLDLVP
ncbi:MAG: hypothetical protein M3203_10120 [Actinomycetota bacterium]|nr:hypothetical protein [Actinomycetota bacterium]